MGLSGEKKISELTSRGLILAIILTILLAMSNAYLALKLGILTSASIPAAVISMGILRFFKNSSILENNLVQTAASAGEAVAGGIVYTIPALIIIHYWHGFDYWTNFLVAASGGILGVLFSIPLRRILVTDKSLKFPEGRAIAELLKSSQEGIGLRYIFLGASLGGFLELFQLGFKILASSFNLCFIVKRSLVNFGLGFSATMIGAGYLIGYDMALSILLGAIVAWVFLLPIASSFYPELVMNYPADKALSLLWNSQMRYLGIGAMLFAGIWTFITLIKPLAKNIVFSFQMSFSRQRAKLDLANNDKDLPLLFILIGVLSLGGILILFFYQIFPLEALSLENPLNLVLIAVLYVLILGFLFSVITGYFSGMVGVTASPGSSIVIAGMLLAAWLLLLILNRGHPLSPEELKAAAAITIIVGSVVTGIAAIANDNTQDLKVGYLLGATPWKQELMLLLGVIISALVIPPVMQLLFDVYGIAGVMPHEGMDESLSLPAPTAALMAAVTEAVFSQTLPWKMMFIGAGIIFLQIIIMKIFQLQRFFKCSILGLAVGMYLPLSSSVPLFFGGLMAKWIKKYISKTPALATQSLSRQQRGVLLACGLVAGSALMDVLLALLFSIFHSPEALALAGKSWEPYGLGLALLTIVGLFFKFKHEVSRD